MEHAAQCGGHSMIAASSCCDAVQILRLSSKRAVRSYDPMGWEYPSWAHINGPAVNLLKGGILTADRVMTVSKVRAQP